MQREKEHHLMQFARQIPDGIPSDAVIGHLRYLKGIDRSKHEIAENGNGITEGLQRLDEIQKKARANTSEAVQPNPAKETVVWNAPSSQELREWKLQNSGEIRYLGQLKYK